MVKYSLRLVVIALMAAITNSLVPPLQASAVGKDTVLRELQQTFKQRRPRKEGIRRGGVCALSPGTDVLQKNYVIWSDRPLFLWQSNDRQIVVQRLRVLQAATDEIVWEQGLQSHDHQVIYKGKPLQPGQTYSWELAFQRDIANTQPDVVDYRFQVMDTTQRNRITSELQTVTTRLKTSGASPEAIALEQARYFANLGLLSDALQILYSLKSPSVETVQLLQDLTNSACSAGIKAP